MAGRILIYGEIREAGIATVSLELLGRGKELAQTAGLDVSMVLIGRNAEACAQTLSGYPLNRIYTYELTEPFRADVYAELLSDCLEAEQPDILLVGGTPEGRTVAPRVAAKYRTGITADCTELHLDEMGRLVQVRPAFGGNIMAQIITPQRRPQIATVRPGVLKAAVPQEKMSIGEILQRSGVWAKSGIQVLSTEKKIREQSIEDADILIAAGRGVKDKEDLEMLRQLAALLGGQLASSRALVEKGWMPHDRQIGLSGHAVAPKILLTFGVSGSVQFQAGIQNAKVIVAVDENPNADIFTRAHYPICADLYDTVPKLIQNLTEK